jgi:hypothetical protein
MSIVVVKRKQAAGQSVAQFLAVRHINQTPEQKRKLSQ